METHKNIKPIIGRADINLLFNALISGKDFRLSI